MAYPLRYFFPLLLLLSSSLRAYDITGFTPDQLIEYKQTVNSSDAAVTLNLDVFTPEGHQASDSRPAIVFFFGGGWTSGSPSQFHPHCEYLASRGMVAISAEYRVKNTHGTSPQECVKDGKSAIRYLRGNAATLGIDPNRIAAGGGSAGGHVAAATGTLSAYEEAGENLSVSSKPNALVLFNPVYDNGPDGYGYSTVQAYWADISPLHNIDSSIPPVVVFLGTNDSLIPVATAEDFKAQMEAAGVRSDLHLYQDQPHGFFNYDQPDDGKGPYPGYNATVFAMDEFLVSLGYLDEPHTAPDPVTDWVTIFGDAGFASGSQATSSPVTTDADTDAIAANIAPLQLNDGDFIRLTGSVTLDAPLTAQNFRIGLFDGDDPAVAGDGSGYAGIWAEAPDTASANIADGDGTGSSHPFETATATLLGTVPGADATVPASTEVEFSLMLSRNGDSLDLTARFTDGDSYDQEQNLLNQTLTVLDYNSVALLMTGNLDATQGSFSNIAVTSGPILPTQDTGGGSDPTSSAITYLDAVEGTTGNTFATGSTPADVSWVGPDSSSASATQWNEREAIGGANGPSLFQGASTTTPPPELTTRISGLEDGDYIIWAFFWDQVDSTSQNWVLSTGLDSGALANYSAPGQPEVAGTTKAGVYYAGDLSFDSSVNVDGYNDGNPTLLRKLFGVELGQVTVSGGADLDVFIGNNITSGANNRAWFDGVGYARVVPQSVLGPRLFGVEFNRNDAYGSPSQSLFRIVSGSTTQGDNAHSYTKTIGSRQVTISQPDAVNFEFRGANGDSSRAIPGGDTSLSFLVADFIATREGAIDIEISDLPAGDYFFRSYHLDTYTGSALGFAQGATTTTPNTIEASIGGATQASIQPDALGVDGLGTTFIDDSQVPTLDFTFTHDGTAPLVIQLRATESNGSESFLLLNGFEIFSSDSP